MCIRDSNNIVPNVLMAYVCIQILKITGALAFCGKLFAPVMAVFGLPGEGIMVILSALMSMGGAVGVAAVSYTHLDVYKRQRIHRPRKRGR